MPGTISEVLGTRTLVKVNLGKTVTRHGTLKEFCPASDSIKTYLQRVNLCFAANSVRDDKKVVILLRQKPSSNIEPGMFWITDCDRPLFNRVELTIRYQVVLTIIQEMEK